MKPCSARWRHRPRWPRQTPVSRLIAARTALERGEPEAYEEFDREFAGDRFGRVVRALTQRDDLAVEAPDAPFTRLALRQLFAEETEAGRAVRAEVAEQNRWHLGRGREQVVHKGARQQLSAVVVDELLEQRTTDALGDPAYDHPPSYNQGVVIDLIRKRIEARGRGDALGA